MSEATCPVAKHDKRYSAVGLLQRYAGHKVDHLRTRLLFALGWCVFVAFMASPAIAVSCFFLVLIGDLVETFFMRRLVLTPIDDIDPKRARLVGLTTSMFDTVLFAASASLPTYLCTFEMMHDHGHWEPIFTIYLLMGTGLAYLMFVPLNPLAVSLRASIYFLVPLGILVIGGPADGVDPMVHELDIGGALVFTLIAIWIGRLVISRHDRRRRMELKQATQQRELRNAYAQMYAQQLESRRLALVAKNASDSVMIINRDFKITWVNESFTRITGYNMQEAIGKTPSQLLDCDQTDTSITAEIDAKLLRGENVRAVLLNRRKDGKRIWLETSQVPMQNAHGELETIIAVERDITSAKEHENELERAREAAEEGARTKAEFLATMSHEIRTPLNGVIGMTQLLEQTNLDAEQRNFAETIHTSASSLLALINDVLELSKMDARDVSLAPVRFSVRKCFEATVALLTPLAQDKGIFLELDVAEDVPQFLLGDDRRITQILTNVVGNAIKFTSEGGVRIVVTCEWLHSEPHLCFAVEDTGIGIQPDMQDRIFERFSQADAAISRRFGGTGLGLTISRRLAHAMGGEITVFSRPGEGSCFTTRLVLKSAPADNDAQKTIDVSEKKDLTGVRILVAEDNQVNRLLVQKFLKDSGAKLGFALDGQQAIERAKALEPDIILMDLSMPNVNGLEATRAIRDLPIAQPYIVALTANAFDDDRAACLEAGMDDFLSKPVSRQQLLDNLIDAISSKHAESPAVSLCASSDAILSS